MKVLTAELVATNRRERVSGGVYILYKQLPVRINNKKRADFSIL